MADDDDQGRRRRRRAVGPPGAATAAEPVLDLDPPADHDHDPADDDRLRRDRPPHHDRGV